MKARAQVVIRERGFRRPRGAVNYHASVQVLASVLSNTGKSQPRQRTIPGVVILLQTHRLSACDERLTFRKRRDSLPS